MNSNVEAGSPSVSLSSERLAEGSLSIEAWQEVEEGEISTLVSIVDDLLGSWVNQCGPGEGKLDPRGVHEAELIARLLEAEAARIRLKWVCHALMSDAGAVGGYECLGPDYKGKGNG